MRPLPKEIVTALEIALECQVESPSSKSSNVSLSLHWEKTHATVGSLWVVSDKLGMQSRAPQIDITELETLFCKLGSEKLKPGHHDLVQRDTSSNFQIMIRNISIPQDDIILRAGQQLTKGPTDVRLFITRQGILMEAAKAEGCGVGGTHLYIRKVLKNQAHRR
ncbi:hypothetical protein L2E82_49520 [Cichorium intybus]|uniref:Uncharacterized protein n=1 Tax=Cichorium intybus TaxID=13427 RepID=A0ACB8Z1L5_CICIN|nr:hypothetical protein L2E82_49520 [Cichorium intybus]